LATERHIMLIASKENVCRRWPNTVTTGKRITWSRIKALSVGCRSVEKPAASDDI